MEQIQKSEVAQIEAEIIILKNQTAQNIIEIGRRLIHAKEILPHGEWGKWLEKRVDFSWDTANNFMRVAREFPNSETIRNLSTSKVYALLSLPIEERESFVQENPVDEMTTRELRQAIKEKKKAEDQLAEKEKEIEELKNREPEVIEREVFPFDYPYLKKKVTETTEALEHANREKALLEKKAKLNEEEAKKFNDMKKQVEFLYKEKADLARQIESATELSGLAVKIDNLLKKDLAPIKYSRVLERMDSEVARNNLLDILDQVSKWCDDMRQMVPEKYRRVEVYHDGLNEN